MMKPNQQVPSSVIAVVAVVVVGIVGFLGWRYLNPPELKPVGAPQGATVPTMTLPGPAPGGKADPVRGAPTQAQ